MKELSSQQWRALAQAYPFYLSGAEGGCSADGHQGRDRGSDPIQNSFAAPTVLPTGFFLEYVVPRVTRVFPEELDAYGKDCASRVRGDPTDSDGLDATSSHAATEAVDALLRYLFGCDSSVLSGVSLAGRQDAASQITFAQHVKPLSQGELRLLGLYHRKQEQYSNLLSNQQQLLAASHLAVQTLQRASGPIMAETRSSEPGAQWWTDETLAPLTCENLTLLDRQRRACLWPSMSAASPSHLRSSTHVAQTELASPAPGQNGARGADASPVFTSVLASIPYGGHPSETLAGAAVTAGDPSVTDTPGASLLRCADAGNAPALVVVNRCAGCQEVGGDLLVCTQCGEIRHEVCGGPHPPAVSKVNGGMSTVNVCRRCAKVLNLSSSSSSLRSSTSTSERAALDDYFGTEDDDSSLSGFIVNTSDDEEEEEEEEEEDSDQARGAGNAGGASEEERTTCKGRDKVQHGRYPSKKTRPLSHRTGRQADKFKEKRTSGAAASDISSKSSDASASSSCIWSRSASLDRALAGTEKKKTESRSAKKGGVGDRSVDVGSQREARRRQREKRRRRSGEDNGDGRRRLHRKRTGDDANDASSSAPNTSSDSSSSPTKESRRLETGKEKMSSQLQFCTPRPPSRRHRDHTRQLTAHPGEGGTVDSPGDRRHTELSLAQSDRKMVLEDEEELSALGIVSSSLGGAQLQSSPSSSKRRQGGIANLRAGRKSVMDIGSSSSSEDSD